MVCLGFEPRAAGWQVQTKPRSYGGHPRVLYFSIVFMTSGPDEIEAYPSCLFINETKLTTTATKNILVRACQELKKDLGKYYRNANVMSTVSESLKRATEKNHSFVLQKTSSRDQNVSHDWTPLMLLLLCSVSMDHLNTQMLCSVSMDHLNTQMLCSVSMDHLSTQILCSVSMDHLNTQILCSVSMDQFNTQMLCSVSLDHLSTQMLCSVSMDHLSTQMKEVK